MSLLYRNVKVDDTNNMSNVMRCYGKIEAYQWARMDPGAKVLGSQENGNVYSGIA